MNVLRSILARGGLLLALLRCSARLTYDASRRRSGDGSASRRSAPATTRRVGAAGSAPTAAVLQGTARAGAAARALPRTTAHQRCPTTHTTVAKACGSGSGCVYVNESASVCLPGLSVVIELSCGAPLDDGAQCGGQGYSGCQTCQPGSQCVPRTPWISVCVADGGKVRPEQATTVINDDDLIKVGAWVKNIDPVLDEDLQNMNRHGGGNETNTTASIDSNAIRRRISKAFATDDGLQTAQGLMQSSADFRAFNDESAAVLQKSLCATIQSPTSLVPEDVRECVCRNTDKPFVHCVARLEQEVYRHLEDRSINSITDRPPSSVVARELPSCAITFQGVDRKFHFVRYATAVAQQIKARRNSSSASFPNGPAVDVCLGGRCNVPLFPLPLDASFGVEACAPDLGLSNDDVGKIADLGVRRSAAARTVASVYANICLSGSQEVQSFAQVLHYVGLDLCVIHFKGSIRPLLGLLEGEATAAAAIVHAKGDVLLQYETDTRDALRLCPEGVARCEDCAMCAGDVRATIEVEVRLLFTSFQVALGKANPMETCRSVDSNTGRCTTGVGVNIPETAGEIEAFSVGTVPGDH
jgi:hypothetical protein